MEAEYYLFSVRYSSLTQSQHPVARICLNKQFLILTFFNKSLYNIKINTYSSNMHMHSVVKCNDEPSSFLERFFKFILGFLLKDWDAERKKCLKHLFLPLDLRIPRSDDSGHQTNWKAVRLSWLPICCRKYDPPWTIIFKDWKDNKLNSTLSYCGATPASPGFFMKVRTHFIPEEIFDTEFIDNTTEKNTMYTAGLICCSCSVTVRCMKKGEWMQSLNEEHYFWKIHVGS